MFMIAMSLTISLVSIQGFYALTRQQGSSNQTPKNQRIQQENKDATTGPASPRTVPPLFPVKPIALPSGDNAWTVQIVTDGGLTGSGRGDLTGTSEGNVSRSGAEDSCHGRLNYEAMQGLA